MPTGTGGKKSFVTYFDEAFMNPPVLISLASSIANGGEEEPFDYTSDIEPPELTREDICEDSVKSWIDHDGMSMEPLIESDNNSPSTTKKSKIKSKGKSGSRNGNKKATVKKRDYESHQDKRFYKDGKLFYKCNLCDYTTNLKGNLKAHLRFHTREKPFKCQHPNCEKAFRSNGHLTRHQLAHNKTNESMLRFKCPMCPYKTGLNENLTSHMRTHSEVKEFGCGLCSYQAKQKEHLKSHYKYVHSNEKPFKCPQSDCEFSCKSKSDLQNHVRVHSDEFPFSCSYDHCGFRAKWKNDLRKHEMIHRGEKRYKCSHCPYSAVQASNLQTHLKIHNRDPHYPCSNCPYRAKTSRLLTWHVERVHQRKNSKEQCPGDRRIPKKCYIPGCDFKTRMFSILAGHLTQAHSLPQVVVSRL